MSTMGKCPTICPHIGFMHTEIGKPGKQRVLRPFWVTSRIRRRSFDANKFQLSPEPKWKSKYPRREEGGGFWNNTFHFFRYRLAPILDSIPLFAAKPFMRSHLIKMALIEKGQGNEDGEAIATSYKGLQLAYIAGKKASPIPGGKFSFVHSLRNGEIIASQFFLLFLILKFTEFPCMHFSSNKATLEFRIQDVIRPYWFKNDERSSSIQNQCSFFQWWFIYEDVSRTISSKTFLVIIHLYHLSAYYRSILLDWWWPITNNMYIYYLSDYDWFYLCIPFYLSRQWLARQTITITIYSIYQSGHEFSIIWPYNTRCIS